MYPQNFDELQAELLVHAQDGRSDAGFRLAIAVSQLGPLASHFTHDKEENPIARPYGTRQGEISDAGHALVQLMTYVALRKISIQEAINSALDNLREHDFAARTPVDATITGVVASPGNVAGAAFVDPYCECLIDMPHDSILVTVHPTTKDTPLLLKAKAIVTDHGGLACHAAIVAREFNIPCIVGTGHATQMIRTGDKLIIENGVVTIVED